MLRVIQNVWLVSFRRSKSLPKNITSRLQPLDAGIIQNFKVKCRKRLVTYVLTRINEDASATQIVKGVNIIVAIQGYKKRGKK